MHLICRYRHQGSALIDVLLSLSIIATLAVTGSQIQLKQRRLQDLLAQRLNASALLDAWAEQRQMSTSANVDEALAMRRHAWDRADAEAALRLPEGRAYQREIGDAFVALEIRWRAPFVAMQPETGRSPSDARWGHRHASGGMQAGNDLLCESILVSGAP